MNKFIKNYYILFIYCVYLCQGMVVHTGVVVTRPVAACGKQFSPLTRNWTQIAGPGGMSLATDQPPLAHDTDFTQKKVAKHADRCIHIYLHKFWS